MEKCEIRPLAVPKPPEPMVTKFGVGDDVGDPYFPAKFHYYPIRGFCSSAPAHPAYKVTRLVISDPRPWDLATPYSQALCTILTINTSNDVVTRKDVPLGGWTKKRKFWAVF